MWISLIQAEQVAVITAPAVTKVSAAKTSDAAASICSSSQQVAAETEPVSSATITGAEVRTTATDAISKATKPQPTTSTQVTATTPAITVQCGYVMSCCVADNNSTVIYPPAHSLVANNILYFCVVFSSLRRSASPRRSRSKHSSRSRSSKSKSKSKSRSKSRSASRK